MFWHRLKALPWWAISLSFGVNIIALAAAIFLISRYRDGTPLIVVGFLFIHVFVSQPLKDWLIVRLHTSSRAYPWIGSVNFENRMQRIMRMNDALDFLNWLIRHWKLSRLRVVLFDDKSIVYYLAAGKKPRKMVVRDEIPEAFQQELLKNKSGAYTFNLSSPVKAYLQARKVKFVVPLLFRERLIGVIGLNERLDKIRERFIVQAAQRISLAVENERLERTVPRSEFLKQEFRLAEKIERHLNGVSEYRINGYTIQKLNTAWEKKHFTAIFGCAPGEGVHFVMLLRLERASTRSNALQLFTMQGYFYSLSRGLTDVSQLADALHSAVVHNENQKFFVEGFLLSFSATMRITQLLAFGSHLAYRGTTGWAWMPESPPLGSNGFSSKAVIEVVMTKDLVLSMREYPLVLIGSSV